MKTYFRLPLIFVLAVAGCADDEVDSAVSTTEPAASESKDFTTGGTAESEGVAAVGGQDSADNAPMKFAPLKLTAGGRVQNSDSTAAALSSEQQIAAVMEKLKPLQIVLGEWRGTTRKEFDGFKAVDHHEWIWDLQTDPQQPALTLTSDKSPYLRTARLTWDAEQSKFRLKATDADGTSRDFEGDFTEPVREVVGPDDKLHRVFRLQLTETPASVAAADGEAWQVAFAQQENNRYLLQVDKRRGSADFRRYDTVSTQREGTSFALDDSDYGEKTCIISQGLGTMTVSWKGKTYWVCCSGCKAAFEEDPESWIARAEKRAAN